MTKPITDRIAELKAKKEKLAERLVKLETSAKSAERKRETRRKIIVGGAILAHIENDKSFGFLLRNALQKNVLRDADRELIADLLPQPLTAPRALRQS